MSEPREPANFLEQHALETLRAEPSWTINMYVVYNDIGPEVEQELVKFLRPHLPKSQGGERFEHFKLS